MNHLSFETIELASEWVEVFFNKQVGYANRYAVVYERKGVYYAAFVYELRYAASDLPFDATIVRSGEMLPYLGAPNAKVEWTERRSNYTNETKEVLQDAGMDQALIDLLLGDVDILD